LFVDVSPSRPTQSRPDGIGPEPGYRGEDALLRRLGAVQRPGPSGPGRVGLTPFAHDTYLATELCARWRSCFWGDS
jgi:hypothetical protein